ncbi:MAG: type II toxin-antitoxin system PemK/MazF family toxin [Magnetococcus sp. YQC-9]
MGVKRAGQIALTRFPSTDFSEAKLRPVLLLHRASRRFDDWLVCMISSRLGQAEPELDEWIGEEEADFASSGLKVGSIVRLNRLAVLDGALLVGALGSIDEQRLMRIRHRLAEWILCGAVGGRV